MNNKIIIGAVALGAVIGGAASYLDSNKLNRHFNSSTIAYVEASNPDDSFAKIIPLRFELTLKENSGYDVYAAIPNSKVGYMTSGDYTLDSDGVFFNIQTHSPLRAEYSHYGPIEQLFLRRNAFEGHRKVAKLEDNKAALIGHKVVLLLNY
ncbi:hypothetical protein [Vibrio sinaloensis]|uniref:hypothetical protein n=1 Tax=Photobacterium sp. (strain ATCC 43367) TaxID=379097 RepID=UPI002F3E342A